MNLKRAIRNLLDSVKEYTDWTGTYYEVDKEALNVLRRAYEIEYGKFTFYDEWDEVLKDLDDT